MTIPQVTILDGDGSHVWDGSLLQFARDNSRDLAREVIAQWRTSLEVNGRLEPAFVGGGAAEHFQVLL
jgi:hypothetical protein